MATMTRPPRDGLVRAEAPGTAFELRDDGDSSPTLTGHFAVFNDWTEIRSTFEGHFLERFAPGAFSKTISEQRDSMRVLFNHGHDPVAGDKPLGPITALEEDDTGARYEVDLLDTSYVRDLVPGLRSGLYGASFRFRVMREEIDDEPERSDRNPDGIPERTVKEASVMEFGPVTFPAYANATAGVRSATDEWILAEFTDHPERLRNAVENDEQLRDVLAPLFVGVDVDDEPEAETAEGSTEVPASTTPGRRSTSSAGRLLTPPRKENKWPRPR